MVSNQVKEWLLLNDNEVGTLQNFVIDYVKQNDLSKEYCYVLGVFSTQFQFYMRCLKDVLYSKNDTYLENVVYFLKTLDYFDGLCLFAKNKLISYYNNFSEQEKFSYLKEDKFNTSFFKRNELECIDIVNKDWLILLEKTKPFL